ncbi:acyl-CoA dehydrogenase [candidate division LCP-89 bacterium B3_LCP]|uniref:Acyl-CoA dehydrogenase n=1 Tax=candidate division LCP-89 bacterium B3_LCP TaxID=2012998 RepID=A0A532UYV5_UNCL8|nr:MAG: acyl-CoA dehydrogenase [candidate division LCP-89 bacterium B3_LCP]
MSIPDLYNIESLFSEDELMVRDSVRLFVQDKILPKVKQWNREAVFPKQLIPEIADLGLLGAYLTGYGCPGISYNAYGFAMQELERGDSGFRSFVSVQNGLCMYPINAFGSDEQKEKWLPPMARGKKIGCFGLTEPDFGSDPSGMITTAKKQGSEYILNGTKMWITNGSIADIAIVFAKTDDGVNGFLVEKGTPGFTAPEIQGKLSLRVSVTSELLFDNCRISAENVLPGAKGLKAALMCLNQARFSIAWGVIGAALACFEEALEYAKTRIQFSKPIASFQLVQAKFAQMWTEIVKAQFLCYRLGQLMDQGKATPAAISMAKRNNVHMALNVARTCRDILGAAGIVDDYHVMRHMDNLESVYTYEGTHDIHTLILGQELTGIGAFG